MGPTHPEEAHMSDQNDTKPTAQSQSGSKPMHLAMLACCVVMFIPIVGFFLAGGAFGGAGYNLFTFAPLLLCVGVHFVMHKVMGKSCHKSDSGADDSVADNETHDIVIREVSSAVPQVRRG